METERNKINDFSLILWNRFGVRNGFFCNNQGVFLCVYTERKKKEKFMEEEIKKQERQEGLHLARKTNGKRRNTTNSKGERKPRIPRQNGKNEN